MSQILHAATIAPARRSLRAPTTFTDSANAPTAALPEAPVLCATVQNEDAEAAALQQALEEKIRAELKRELQEEAGRIGDLAREQGLQEGRAAGREAVEQALDAQLAELHRLTKGIGALVERETRANEALASEIAMAALVKLFGDHALSRDGIATQVADAMRELHDAHQATVRLHPDDLAYFRENNVPLPQHAQDDERIPLTWKADSSISHGGCLVESDVGNIDARLDQQLQKILAILKRR